MLMQKATKVAEIATNADTLSKKGPAEEEEAALGEKNNAGFWRRRRRRRRRARRVNYRRRRRRRRVNYRRRRTRRNYRRRRTRRNYRRRRTRNYRRRRTRNYRRRRTRNVRRRRTRNVRRRRSRKPGLAQCRRILKSKRGRRGRRLLMTDLGSPIDTPESHEEAMLMQKATKVAEIATNADPLSKKGPAEEEEAALGEKNNAGLWRR